MRGGLGRLTSESRQTREALIMLRNTVRRVKGSSYYFVSTSNGLVVHDGYIPAGGGSTGAGPWAGDVWDGGC